MEEAELWAGALTVVQPEVQPEQRPDDPKPKPPDKLERGVQEQSHLPLWMRNAHAKIIPDQRTTLQALHLDPRFVQKLQRMGILDAFPVQATLIPVILQDATTVGGGRDLCCCAPTGSGKTLAYALPVLQDLLSFKSSSAPFQHLHFS